MFVKIEKMEIDKELYKEIKEYCLLNGLKPKDYIHDLLKKAFMRDKYGERPNFMILPLRPEPKVETVPAEVTVVQETTIDVKTEEPKPVVEEPAAPEEKKEENFKLIETKPRKRKLN